MDDRQREVQIGAGLQESRLNTELIGFLQVWGPRVLYALLAIVLVYIGMQYLERQRIQRLDEAYSLLDARIDSGQVLGLVELGEEQRSKHAIWTMSNLMAARLAIAQVRLGFESSDVPADATEPVQLTDEEKLARIDAVLDPLREVAKTNSTNERALFAAEAYWSLASLLLSKAMLMPDQRESLLEDVRNALRAGIGGSRDAGLEVFAERFESRYGSLFGVGTGIQFANLPRRADLPESARRPEEAQPATQPQTPISILGGGQQGQQGAIPLQMVPQNGAGELDIQELMRRAEEMQGQRDTSESTPAPVTEPSDEPGTR